MSAQTAVAPAFVESPELEPAFNLRTVKRRALVVDDNSDIADMLAAVLRHVGYEVLTADSGSNALVAALAEHFDVVISDIGMPGMNGYELARSLRAIPEYSTIPMVAVTGFAMYDDRDRALDAGFNTHLSKPIDPVTLTQVISGVWH
jgi:CheY-like chemotaxis protein